MRFAFYVFSLPPPTLRRRIFIIRQRIRQADAMGEFALGEILRKIIEQEQDHLLDLADALGIDAPKIGD
jgi:bacterioferritin